MTLRAYLTHPRRKVIYGLVLWGLLWFVIGHACTAQAFDTTKHAVINDGPILVEWREGFPPVECPAVAWQAGQYAEAIINAGLIGIYIECTLVQPHRCLIVATDSDYALGHGMEHCRYGTDTHLPFPFAGLLDD